MLVFRLRLDQTGGYRGTRLKKMDPILCALEYLGNGFVLMSPHDQMEELRDHAFRD
jgi:hypothetical protein